MNVRVTQIDGKLPNLALMAISAHHRALGDDIHFTRDVERGLFEPEYGVVYGSCIFQFARHRLERFHAAFPGAVIGGTGTFTQTRVEDVIGEFRTLDYSLYPEFAGSIGFTQRGCRLACKFCVVPKKEGKNRSVNTIDDIWRGPGHAKKLHLLDNDFFGQPREQWMARAEEIRAGGFKVCLNQGINVRLLDQEAAHVLASLEYRDDQFQKRTLYTAWDNIGDEKIFFGGIDRLETAGIPPRNVMAYMLIGFDITETWDRIWHRFNRMVERGIRPYPMVYDRKRTDLLCFQRWVLTGLYRIVKWDEYRRSTKSNESMEAYMKTIPAPPTDSTKPLERCKDCDDCARHAYSDATTPGFFYDKCERHRKPSDSTKEVR